MKERRIGRHETSRGCIFLSSIRGSRVACRSQWALIVRVEERCQEVTSRPKVCRCRFLKWGPVRRQGKPGTEWIQCQSREVIRGIGRPMPGGILDSKKEDRRKRRKKAYFGKDERERVGVEVSSGQADVAVLVGRGQRTISVRITTSTVYTWDIFPRAAWQIHRGHVCPLTSKWYCLSHSAVSARLQCVAWALVRPSDGLLERLSWTSSAKLLI